MLKKLSVPLFFVVVFLSTNRLSAMSVKDMGSDIDGTTEKFGSSIITPEDMEIIEYLCKNRQQSELEDKYKQILKKKYISGDDCFKIFKILSKVPNCDDLKNPIARILNQKSISPETVENLSKIKKIVPQFFDSNAKNTLNKNKKINDKKREKILTVLFRKIKRK